MSKLNKLKLYMFKQKLGQHHLAELLGVSQPFVCYVLTSRAGKAFTKEQWDTIDEQWLSKKALSS